MAELKYFTIVEYAKTVILDGSDDDTDPDTSGITATVTVTPKILGYPVLRATGLNPPTLLTLGTPFRALLDGGRLKTRTGQNDLRLAAKCSALNIGDAALTYTIVTKNATTSDGSSVSLPTITIEAPTVADDWDDEIDGPVVLDITTVEWLESSPSTASGYVIRHVPDDVRVVSGAEIQFYASGDPLGDPMDFTEAIQDLAVEVLHEDETVTAAAAAAVYDAIRGAIGSGLHYRGLWNASANSPTLADGTGTAGDQWLATTAGTRNLGSGSQVFAAGDYAIYNGSVWQRVDAAMVLAAGQVIKHGSNTNFVRPGGAPIVLWAGTVEPDNALDGDIWLDYSGTGPSITTTILDSLNVDAVFSQTLLASGSTPLVWNPVPVAGSLPGGLSLSEGGNLYGSPTSTGAYDFTVSVDNGYGSDTKQYTGTVLSALAPTILTTDLGSITSGAPFSVALSVSGSATITFAVHSGSLPTGLSLDADTGEISGTASATGSYTATIRASNGAGYGDRTFTGSVTGIAPTITTTELNPMWRAFEFSQTVAAAGTPSITWSKPSGSYPTGISLTGATLSGTPSVVGAYDFTLRAHNAYSPDYDREFTGTVVESTPVVTETSLNALAVSTAFTQTLHATGGPTLTWSAISGLPTGLSISSPGVITGTPTTSGSYTATIRASNGVDHHDRVFTGTVGGLTPTPDAVGTGGTGTTLPSPTITVAGGANNVVLAWISAQTVTSITAITASCSGSAMTLLGSFGVAGLTTTKFWLFALQGPSAGAKTITFSPTGAGSTHFYAANAVSYNDVGSIGTPVTNGGTGTSLSHSVSSAANRLVAQAFMVQASNVTVGSYSQTSRVNYAGTASINDAFMFGDGPGGASATSFTATIGSSNPWGSLAVELLPV